MLNREITLEDQQLLHATLSNGEKAAEAWWAWRANFDFDQSGPRNAPLIPLLHQNLLRLGIDDPLIGKFKGIHRRTWYKNQLQLTQVCDLLHMWQDDGITAMCLTDIALVAQYYSDIGMRPIRSRFLVPNSMANQAIQLLQGAGWSLSDDSLPDNFIEMRHSCRLTHEHNGNLHLQWHLFPKRLYSGSDEGFWIEKHTLQLQGISAYSLNPTDQLLYSCVQGRFHHALPLWVADALTLLRHSKNGIEWSQFCSHCRYGNLVQPARNALSYLSSEFNAPIPSSVLETLRLVSLYRRTRNIVKRWSLRI